MNDKAACFFALFFMFYERFVRSVSPFRPFYSSVLVVQCQPHKTQLNFGLLGHETKVMESQEGKHECDCSTGVLERAHCPVGRMMKMRVGITGNTLTSSAAARGHALRDVAVICKREAQHLADTPQQSERDVHV